MLQATVAATATREAVTATRVAMAVVKVDTIRATAEADKEASIRAMAADRVVTTKGTADRATADTETKEAVGVRMVSNRLTFS